jgi:hypothetical protein
VVASRPCNCQRTSRKKSLHLCLQDCRRLGCEKTTWTYQAVGKSLRAIGQRIRDVCFSLSMTTSPSIIGLLLNIHCMWQSVVLLNLRKRKENTTTETTLSNNCTLSFLHKSQEKHVDPPLTRLSLRSISLLPDPSQAPLDDLPPRVVHCHLWRPLLLQSSVSPPQPNVSSILLFQLMWSCTQHLLPSNAPCSILTYIPILPFPTFLPLSSSLSNLTRHLLYRYLDFSLHIRCLTLHMFPILCNLTYFPSPFPSPLQTNHQANPSFSLYSPWFRSLLFLELTYHLPLSLWAIPALLRSDPRVPLALLVFGVETCMSTLVCMAEMLSWEELSAEQRGVQGLGGMYGGYLALGIFMTLDCYARLDGWIAGQKGLVPVKKGAKKEL